MTTKNLRRICLVGVRGVGKTTLIHSVKDMFPDIDYIVGSAILRELAGESFHNFDHQPAAVKQGFREAAIDWMIQRQQREGRHILCDGHTSLLDASTGAVAPVFTERDCTFFRELILLQAPVDVILQRRHGDTSKRRSLDPDVIALELAGELEASRSLAEHWGIRFHCLPNNTSSSARDRFMKILS